MVLFKTGMEMWEQEFVINCLASIYHMDSFGGEFEALNIALMHPFSRIGFF
jgi:hypothetical protein